MDNKSQNTKNIFILNIQYSISSCRTQFINTIQLEIKFNKKQSQFEVDEEFSAFCSISTASTAANLRKTCISRLEDSRVVSSRGGGSSIYAWPFTWRLTGERSSQGVLTRQLSPLGFIWLQLKVLCLSWRGWTWNTWKYPLKTCCF